MLPIRDAGKQRASRVDGLLAPAHLLLSCKRGEWAAGTRSLLLGSIARPALHFVFWLPRTKEGSVARRIFRGAQGVPVWGPRLGPWRWSMATTPPLSLSDNTTTLAHQRSFECETKKTGLSCAQAYRSIFPCYYVHPTFSHVFASRVTPQPPLHDGRAARPQYRQPPPPRVEHQSSRPTRWNWKLLWGHRCATGWPLGSLTASDECSTRDS